MAYETVVVDETEHVGTITLDRPEAMNTFSTALAQDLDSALRDLDENDEVRAIIVAGAGDAFSAGIDLTEHGEFDSQREYRKWVGQMEAPFLTLKNMSTPVIAAAHGHAAANGIGLVAACDLAVLAEGTMLGATAPKVGLFCMGPAVPLMGSLTQKRCLELLLTGELIDAETALDWGLVNRVVPEENLEDAARTLAESMTQKSPVAVQMGKEAYYVMNDLDYETALEYSNEQFATLCTTGDANEGIDAFLSGREPEWPGE
ncbi:enoyl-CoA hydratase/isomerase family protein [Halococcus sediminicola]|uniref:enoyl-CoA hydratase/isomerase family protein n=1 Tax=Halococcus sediminicola TaxID=1264579 RepID=UPI00067988D8|nr:enoyl-CoA hydratase-related protein [Halococcus sediminicola]